MCAFGSSTPRAPRGRQFEAIRGGRGRAGASCATCGRMLIPHSRMRYGSEYSDPARGARPARAAGVCSPRLDVTFSLVRFRRPARLGGSHTNLGPAGARPLSRFRIVILRVWHAGLPMAMLHASMLPGFVVHAPWHSLASPRGRMCSYVLGARERSRGPHTPLSPRASPGACAGALRGKMSANHLY